MLKGLKKWPAVSVTAAAAVAGGVVGAAFMGSGEPDVVELVDASTVQPAETAEPTETETAAPVEPSAPAPVESEPAATVEPVTKPAPQPPMPQSATGRDPAAVSGTPEHPLAPPSLPSPADIGENEGGTQGIDY